jgi:hypothetical protein
MCHLDLQGRTYLIERAASHPHCIGFGLEREKVSATVSGLFSVIVKQRVLTPFLFPDTFSVSRMIPGPAGEWISMIRIVISPEPQKSILLFGQQSSLIQIEQTYDS